MTFAPIRSPDDRPGDTDRHYATATDHGTVHAIGATDSPRWFWRVVSAGNVVARGEVRRQRGETLDDVLAAVSRQAFVGARCAA